MKRLATRALLTACVVALGSPVAGAQAESGTSDAWSEATLTTTYTLNPHLNPFDIEVEVENGVATLHGTVDSDVEKSLAEELALSVDGIGQVSNQLQVVPDTSAQAPHAESGERGFMRKVQDANITAKVKSQLLWNDETDGLDIDVDTVNGKVTLSGDVASATEAELAERIARNTSDVLAVDNRLEVGGRQPAMADRAARAGREIQQEISDGWITTKVKSALLYNRNVEGSDIDVETRNGVVTLTGRVGSAFEKRQAIEVARYIRGVSSVEDRLRTTGG